MARDPSRTSKSIRTSVSTKDPPCHTNIDVSMRAIGRGTIELHSFSTHVYDQSVVIAWIDRAVAPVSRDHRFESAWRQRDKRAVVGDVRLFWSSQPIHECFSGKLLKG